MGKRHCSYFLLFTLLLGSCSKTINSATDASGITRTPNTSTFFVSSLFIEGASVTNSSTLNLNWGSVSNPYTEYCILVNDTDYLHCSWTPSSSLPSTFDASSYEGSVKLSAWIGDTESMSSRIDSNTVVVDLTQPTDPVFVSVNPSSGSSNYAPIISGTVGPNVVSVKIFSDSSCLLQIGQGTNNSIESTGIQVVVNYNATTTLYAQSYDLAGNSSNCTFFANYTHSPTSGNVVSVNYTSITPASNSSTLTPVVKGTTSSGVTNVSLYSDNGCTTLIGSGSKSSFEGAGITATVPSNTTTYIYAVATDTSSNSACTLMTVYNHDNVAPSNASAGSSTPATGSTSTRPLITGTLPSDAETVYLYSNSICTTQIASGLAVIFSTIGFYVDVTASSTTTIYSKTADLSGNISSCSSSPLVTYVNASAPTISFGSITPVSPNTSASPVITGTASANVSTITFYSNFNCTNSIGSGTRAAYQGAGITLSVTNNATTNIYAIATDSYTNTTACTPLTSYLHDNVAPSVVGNVTHSAINSSTSTSPVIYWGNSVDFGSGLAKYEYSIGSVAGLTDIKAWTDVGYSTTAQASGLTLVDGQDYFVNVRATDQVGLTSTVVSSTGWTVDVSASQFSVQDPAEGSDVSTASRLLTGTCMGTNYVTASYSAGVTGPSTTNCEDGFFYIYLSFSGVSGTREVSISQVSPLGDLNQVIRSLDYSPHFQLEQGFNDYPMSMEWATDSSGDLFVGGYFSTFRGRNQLYLAKINRNGTLDNSFNVSNALNSYVYKILPTNDGSGDVYIGGSFTSIRGVTRNYIARLNADGSLDTAFAPTGTGLNDAVYSIEFVPDGSGDIYVGGAFSAYNGSSQNRLVRLNSDGTIDSTLNIGTGFSGGTITDIKIPNDGSNDIYLAGNMYYYQGNTSLNYLVRINSNGSPDTDSGYVNPTLNDQAKKIALDSNNKVYACGAFYVINTVSYNYIARLNTNGTLDTGFNPGTTLSNTCNDIVIDENGKIVIGGYFSVGGYDYIARLNTDGTVDTSLDATHTGTAKGTDSYVFDLLASSDGSSDVIAAGSFTNYRAQNHNRVVRITSSGNPDIGMTTRDGPGYYATRQSMAIANDGSNKIYFGGSYNYFDGILRPNLNRLNPDGSVDSTFVQGAGFDNEVLTVTPDVNETGEIYVGGRFTSYKGNSSITRFVKLLNNGDIDTTFDTGTGFDAAVHVVLQDPTTRKLYVGGDFTTYKGVTQKRLVRLNTDGSVDSTFNIGIVGFNDVVRALLLVDDKLYVGGSFTSFDGSTANYLIRLSDNGASDNSYDTGSGFNGTVYKLAEVPGQPGKIYAAGNFTSYDGTTQYYMTRLTYNASIDSSFATGNGFSTTVLDFAVDTNGQIYVGGSFSTFNGSPTASYLTRINSNGSRDFTFQPILSNTVYAVTLSEDGSGQILYSGVGTSVNGVTRNYFGRLNSDGTLD